MNSSKAISTLEELLKSLEKERESLKHVLLSGKISHNTFDLLNKKIDETILIATKLEGVLKEEESFWKETLLKGIKLFETLLVEFEHKLLLGEIGKEEYQHNSDIISDGLNSIRKQIEQNERRKEQVITAPPQVKKNHTPIKTEKELNQTPLSRNENLARTNRKLVKTIPEDESGGISEIHCMNPWNPECRNTDIEVSIYYNGQMVPICRRCWEEIANKDVEWSSL